MKTITTFAPAALLAGMLAAGPALPQDEGLYPDAPAPDASFLRVHARPGAAVRIDGRSYEIGETGMTPYIEVAPGAVEVRVDDAATTVEAGANQHYSFVSQPDGGALLTDRITGSPAQADLVFYNLSDLGALDLFVTEANTNALAGVAPLQNAGVALAAPLTLSFEVRQDGRTLASVEGVRMERAVGTTILFQGAEGAWAATAANNTYD
jgi:alginate O-acetyltransferase complex protein AlgF